MLDGQQALPPELVNLPNPFIMSEHMDDLVRGLDPAGAPSTVSGGQAFDWLPDLVDSQAGMPKKCNAYQVRRSGRAA